MATTPTIHQFKYKPSGTASASSFLLGLDTSHYYIWNGLDYTDAKISLKPGASFSVESPILDLKGATLNLKGNVINIEGKDSTDSKLVYKSSSYDTISVLCPTTTTHSASKWYGSATLGEQVGARIIAGSCILKGATDTEPGEAVAAIGAHNFDAGGNAAWEDLYIQADGAKDVYIGKGSVGWGKWDGALKVSNNANSRGVYVNTSLDSGTPVWKEVATEDDITGTQSTMSTTFSPAREAWITGRTDNPSLELPSTGWYFVEYIETDGTGGTTHSPVGIIRASTAYRNILLFKAAFYDTNQGCYWFEDYMLTTTQDDKPKMKLLKVDSYNSNGTITSVQTTSSDKIRVKLIAPDTSN